MHSRHHDTYVFQDDAYVSWEQVGLKALSTEDGVLHDLLTCP